MKIKEVKKDVTYYITTDEPGEPTYRTIGDGNWFAGILGTWKQIHAPLKLATLEKLFSWYLAVGK